MSRLAEQRARTTSQDPRWNAVQSRDAKLDGRFYYAVETTGVYCRPSCGSRAPRPENARFFSTREEAEHAGFRPCKRCKPDQSPLPERHAELMARMCRLIESADTPPSLDTLAREAGLSSYHLHRIFKSITGMTPRAYAVEHRARRLRERLADGGQVSEAIYDAGFNSGARFYDSADRILGMKPTRYRDGGHAATIRFAVGRCSLGEILVAASDRGICAISLGDDAEALVHELQDRFPRADLIGGDGDFETLVAQVVGFVDHPNAGWALPLDIRGTAFQQRVWQALREIPAGTTLSYAELAQRLGMPRAVRAVASACAANTLAVAIPCHRVVRTDGGLSGYRWGIERKRALIQREASE